MDFLLNDDQRRLQDTVAEFVQSEVAPRAETLDREARFPTALFHQLADLGVTSIPFEPEWGGMGQGSFEMALVVEEIARELGLDVSFR